MKHLFDEVVKVYVTTEDCVCSLVLTRKSGTKHVYNLYDEYTFSTIINGTNTKSVTNSVLYSISYYDKRTDSQLKQTILKLFRPGKRLDNFGCAFRVDFVSDNACNPIELELLRKIQSLRDFAEQHGYPIADDLAVEYDYYKNEFSK